MKATRKMVEDAFQNECHPKEAPIAVCPYCAAALNGVAASDGTDQSPNPGDMTMCVMCYRISVYTKGLHLRKPREHEKLPPDVIAEAKSIARAIKMEILKAENG